MNLINLNPIGPNRTYTTIVDTDSPNFLLPEKSQFPNPSYLELPADLNPKVVPFTISDPKKRKKGMSKKKKLWLEQNRRVNSITKKLYDQAIEKRSKSVHSFSYQDNFIQDEISRLRKSRLKLNDKSLTFNPKTLIKPIKIGINILTEPKTHEFELSKTASNFKLPLLNKDLRRDSSASQLQKLKYTMSSLLEKKEAENRSFLTKKQDFSSMHKEIKLNQTEKPAENLKFSESQVKKMIENYKDEQTNVEFKIKVIVSTLSRLEQDYNESKLVKYDPKMVHLKTKITKYYKGLHLFQACLEKLRNAIKMCQNNLKKTIKNDGIFNYEASQETDDDKTCSLYLEINKEETKVEEKIVKRGQISFAEFMNMY